MKTKAQRDRAIHGPNETTEMWRDHRRDQQERRRERLPDRQHEIFALREHGFTVVELSAFQFRIDGQLDLYPTHRRYHYLPWNRRGGYREALWAATKFLRSTTR